jgi:hypothetical protein
MYGFQDLASQQQQRFWVYTGNKNNTGFQTWIKPPGISFVHIITIGPGAGGSGTYPYSAGTAARGGSGGGSGAMNSVFLPAYLIPDIIYINVGLGGTGGGSSTVIGTANAGTAGQDLTYVTFYPVKSTGYAVCIASPGGAGTVPAAGAGAIGGNAGATANSTFFPVSQIGLRNYIPGQAGSTGQQNSAGSLTAIYRVTGGAGGSGNTAGNITGNGGGISAVGEYTLQTIAASPAGTNGSQLNDLVKFIFGGGTGAASSTTISGSNGGSGGYGCGGGGGGVGPGLGGAGGAGGDGLVIITCG